MSPVASEQAGSGFKNVESSCCPSAAEGEEQICTTAAYSQASVALKQRRLTDKSSLELG